MPLDNKKIKKILRKYRKTFDFFEKYDNALPKEKEKMLRNLKKKKDKRGEKNA